VSLCFFAQLDSQWFLDLRRRLERVYRSFAHACAFSRIILILSIWISRVTTMTGAALAAISLHQLPNQQWATVLDVVRPDSPEDRELVLRLTEIGFVPGEAVCVVANGVPGREPLAVRLGHTTFALRRHEASLIRVTPGAPGHG
jgi:ferrous iron transport protein A